MFKIKQKFTLCKFFHKSFPWKLAHFLHVSELAFIHETDLAFIKFYAYMKLN